MQKNINAKTIAQELSVDHSKRRLWQRVVSTLVCLVVFCTTYALIMPAITISTGTYCGYNEHTHEDSCYVDGLLICDMTEHIHTLACHSNPDADVESYNDWAYSVMAADDHLTTDNALNVLEIAKTQLGYTESKDNYAVLSDGATVMGYSRYGALAGYQYADWNVSFIEFCVYFAGCQFGVAYEPVSTSATDWISILEAYDLILTSSFTPDEGMLVFFTEDNTTYVGIIESVDTNGNVTAIVGDYDNGTYTDAVTEVTIASANVDGYAYLDRIISFGKSSSLMAVSNETGLGESSSDETAVTNGSVDLDRYIKEVKLQHSGSGTNYNYVDYDPNDSTYKTFEDDTFKAYFSYELPVGTLGMGDDGVYYNSVTYNLPNAITLKQGETGYVSDNGTVVGTYVITTDGKVTITFYDDFVQQNHDGSGESGIITGDFSVYFSLNKDEWNKDGNSKILFSAENHVEIDIKTTETITNDLTVEKASSSYDKASGKIVYSIKVYSTYGTAKTVYLNDIMSNVTYLDGFTVTKYDSTGATDVTSSFSAPNAGSGNIGLTLPQMNAGDYYIITYTGKVTNGNGTVTATNEVYVTSETTGGHILHDSDKVTTNYDYNVIKKSYDYIYDTDGNKTGVKWTVTVGENVDDLGGWTLSDTINGVALPADTKATIGYTAVTGTAPEDLESKGFTVKSSETLGDTTTTIYEKTDNSTTTVTVVVIKTEEEKTVTSPQNTTIVHLTDETVGVSKSDDGTLTKPEEKTDYSEDKATKTVTKTETTTVKTTTDSDDITTPNQDGSVTVKSEEEVVTTTTVTVTETTYTANDTTYIENGTPTTTIASVTDTVTLGADIDHLEYTVGGNVTIAKDAETGVVTLTKTVTGAPVYSDDFSSYTETTITTTTTITDNGNGTTTTETTVETTVTKYVRTQEGESTTEPETDTTTTENGDDTTTTETNTETEYTYQQDGDPTTSTSTRTTVTVKGPADESDADSAIEHLVAGAGSVEYNNGTLTKTVEDEAITDDGKTVTKTVTTTTITDNGDGTTTTKTTVETTVTDYTAEETEYTETSSTTTESATTTETTTTTVTTKVTTEETVTTSLPYTFPEGTKGPVTVTYVTDIAYLPNSYYMTNTAEIKDKDGNTFSDTVYVQGDDMNAYYPLSKKAGSIIPTDYSNPESILAIVDWTYTIDATDYDIQPSVKYGTDSEGNTVYCWFFEDSMSDQYFDGLTVSGNSAYLAGYTAGPTTDSTDESGNKVTTTVYTKTSGNATETYTVESTVTKSTDQNGDTVTTTTTYYYYTYSNPTDNQTWSNTTGPYAVTETDNTQITAVKKAIDDAMTAAGISNYTIEWKYSDGRATGFRVNVFETLKKDNKIEFTFNSTTNIGDGESTVIRYNNADINEMQWYWNVKATYYPVVRKENYTNKTNGEEYPYKDISDSVLMWKFYVSPPEGCTELSITENLPEGLSDVTQLTLQLNGTTFTLTAPTEGGATWSVDGTNYSVTATENGFTYTDSSNNPHTVVFDTDNNKVTIDGTEYSAAYTKDAAGNITKVDYTVGISHTKSYSEITPAPEVYYDNVTIDGTTYEKVKVSVNEYGSITGFNYTDSSGVPHTVAYNYGNVSVDGNGSTATKDSNENIIGFTYNGNVTHTVTYPTSYSTSQIVVDGETYTNPTVSVTDGKIIITYTDSNNESHTVLYCTAGGSYNTKDNVSAQVTVIDNGDGTITAEYQSWSDTAPHTIVYSPVTTTITVDDTQYNSTVKYDWSISFTYTDANNVEHKLPYVTQDNYVQIDDQYLSTTVTTDDSGNVTGYTYVGTVLCEAKCGNICCDSITVDGKTYEPIVNVSRNQISFTYSDGVPHTLEQATTGQTYYFYAYADSWNTYGLNMSQTKPTEEGLKNSVYGYKDGSLEIHGSLTVSRITTKDGKSSFVITPDADLIAYLLKNSYDLQFTIGLKLDDPFDGYVRSDDENANIDKREYTNAVEVDYKTKDSDENEESGKSGDSATQIITNEDTRNRIDKNSYPYTDPKTKVSTIEYTIDINPLKENLSQDSDEITVTDTLSFDSYSTVVSFTVSNVNIYVYDDNGNKTLLDADKWSFTSDKTVESARHTCVLTFTVPDEEHLFIEYTYTFIPLEGNTSFNVYNNARIVESEAYGSSGSNEYENVQAPDANATISKIEIIKVDANNNAKRLEGASFELYKWTIIDETTNEGEWRWVQTLTTDENGTFSLTEIEPNVAYKMVEVSAPDGYILDQSFRYFLIRSQNSSTVTAPEGFSTAYYVTSDVPYMITNLREETTSATAKKIWQDESGKEIAAAEGASVKVKLRRTISYYPKDFNLTTVGTPTQVYLTVGQHSYDSIHCDETIFATIGGILQIAITAPTPEDATTTITKITTITTDEDGKTTTEEEKLPSLPDDIATYTKGVTTYVTDVNGTVTTTTPYTKGDVTITVDVKESFIPGLMHVTDTENNHVTLNRSVDNSDGTTTYYFYYLVKGYDYLQGWTWISDPSKVSVEYQALSNISFYSTEDCTDENGDLMEVTLSSDNGWAYTWDNLPLYELDSSGKIIGYYSYSVEETQVNIPDTDTTKYTTRYYTDNDGNLIVINKAVDYAKLQLKKIWYNSEGVQLTEEEAQSMSEVKVTLYQGIKRDLNTYTVDTDSDAVSYNYNATGSTIAYSKISTINVAVDNEEYHSAWTVLANSGDATFATALSDEDATISVVFDEKPEWVAFALQSFKDWGSVTLKNTETSTPLTITQNSNGTYTVSCSAADLLKEFIEGGYSTSDGYQFVVQSSKTDAVKDDVINHILGLYVTTPVPYGYKLGQMTKSNFGTSGNTSDWDKVTSTITFTSTENGKNNVGWWASTDTTSMTGYDSLYIEFDGTAGAEMAGTVVVQYQNGSNKYYDFNAGDKSVTVPLDPDSGIVQVYILNKNTTVNDAGNYGTLTLGDVYMRQYVAYTVPDGYEIAYSNYTISENSNGESVKNLLYNNGSHDAFFKALENDDAIVYVLTDATALGGTNIILQENVSPYRFSVSPTASAKTTNSDGRITLSITAKELKEDLLAAGVEYTSAAEGPHLSLHTADKYTDTDAYTVYGIYVVVPKATTDGSETGGDESGSGSETGTSTVELNGTTYTETVATYTTSEGTTASLTLVTNDISPNKSVWDWVNIATGDVCTKTYNALENGAYLKFVVKSGGATPQALIQGGDSTDSTKQVTASVSYTYFYTNTDGSTVYYYSGKDLTDAYVTEKQNYLVNAREGAAVNLWNIVCAFKGDATVSSASVVTLTKVTAQSVSYFSNRVLLSNSAQAANNYGIALTSETGDDETDNAESQLTAADYPINLGTYTLNADNHWSYTTRDLPLTGTVDGEMVEFVYWIVEDKVTDENGNTYRVTYSTDGQTWYVSPLDAYNSNGSSTTGDTLYAKNAPSGKEKTSISVRKYWPTNVTPEAITVDLYRVYTPVKAETYSYTSYLIYGDGYWPAWAGSTTADSVATGDWNDEHTVYYGYWDATNSKYVYADTSREYSKTATTITVDDKSKTVEVVYENGVPSSYTDGANNYTFAEYGAPDMSKFLYYDTNGYDQFGYESTWWPQVNKYETPNSTSWDDKGRMVTAVVTNVGNDSNVAANGNVTFNLTWDYANDRFFSQANNKTDVKGLDEASVIIPDAYAQFSDYTVSNVVVTLDGVAYPLSDEQLAMIAIDTNYVMNSSGKWVSANDDLKIYLTAALQDLYQQIYNSASEYSDEKQTVMFSDKISIDITLKPNDVVDNSNCLHTDENAEYYDGIKLTENGVTVTFNTQTIDTTKTTNSAIWLLYSTAANGTGKLADSTYEIWTQYADGTGNTPAEKDFKGAAKSLFYRDDYHVKPGSKGESNLRDDMSYEYESTNSGDFTKLLEEGTDGTITAYLETDDSGKNHYAVIEMTVAGVTSKMTLPLASLLVNDDVYLALTGDYSIITDITLRDRALTLPEYNTYWATSTIENIRTVTLDGADEVSQGFEAWNYTWSNLDLYEYDEDGNITGEYRYYVKEVGVGDATADSDNPYEIGKYVASYSTYDPIQNGTITVTNTPTSVEVTLPESGSTGTQLYTYGGVLLLVMGMTLAWIYLKKRKGVDAN